MPLRPALHLVYHALLEESRETHEITLDDVARAVGTVAVSSAEVEELFDALEAEGRVVVDTRDDGARVSPKESLATVLAAAREIAKDTGKKPTIADLSVHTGLGEETVRAALRFATIMAR